MLKPIGHPLPLINLGIGDISKANGFTLAPEIGESIIEAVQSEIANGYTQQTGAYAARVAIAEKFGTKEHPIDPNNVFLSAGCSGALFDSISAICERGDRILTAKPGFPLIQSICLNLGIEFDCYELLPEQGWNINLEHLKSLI